jgi:hypothetical protein
MKLLKSLAIAAMALALPSMASAAVLYDLTLTDSSNSTYSGTGTITLSSAPSPTTQTNYASAAVTFLIDGVSFSGTATSVQFLDGQFRNATFSEEIGTSPMRFDLQTSGVYAFYYNNELSGASGTITSKLAAGVPEPASWLMMIVGFGGIGAALRRRTAHAGKAIAA